MAARVVSLGKGETHVAATHFIIDPQGILHIYAGEVHTASYRDWSSVAMAVAQGAPPPESETEERVDGAGKVLKTVTEPKPKKPQMSVPRGGFGSREPADHAYPCGSDECKICA